MKNLILILVLIVMSCSSDNNDNKSGTNNRMIGTWRLVETYIGTGDLSTTQWETVENGYTYSFNRDGTFSSSRFSECESGAYEFSEELLTLNFGCDGFTTGIDSPEGTIVENYLLENEFMYLSPTYLSCAEGCSYKFQRISAE